MAETSARILLDDAPVPIVLSAAAPSATLVYLNAAAVAQWRVEPDAVLGQPALLWWADEADRVGFRSEVERQGRVSGLEYLFRRGDGSVFWGSVSSRPTTFEGQRVLFSSITDVTERRRAEAQRAEAERRFHLLAENSLDVIWLLDLAQRRLTYVSPSVERLRGLSVEEALAEPLQASMLPESAARAEQIIAAGGTDPDDPPPVFDQPCRDGSVKKVEVVARFIPGPDGRPKQLLGVSRDVTRRVEAEAARDRLIQELRQALAEVRQLSGLIPICAWCRKVRDDAGYWSTVERYLENHTGAHVTHSMCPACSAKFNGE